MAKTLRSVSVPKMKGITFDSFFELQHTVMLVIDPETGAIVRANPAAVKFYGYDRDVLTSMLITDINQQFPQDVRDGWQRAGREELNACVFSHKLASGEIRLVEVDSSPVNANGKVALSLLIHDITERNQAEAKYRESEERQRAILNNIPDPAWLKDTAGRFQLVNKAWTELFGLTEADVQGKHISEFLFPQLAKRIDSDDRAVVTEGRVLKYEESYENNERRTVWLETVIAPLIDNSGAIIGLTGISRDITERRRTDAALRESEDRYRSLVESSPDGVILHRNGELLYANTAALSMYGVDSFEQVRTKKLLLHNIQRWIVF